MPLISITHRKILIVEDDRKLLFEVVEFFRARNNIVYTAETLGDAMKQYARENDFDAILLDLILPDGTGLDFFNILKPPAPPVVILTNLSDDADVLTGFDAGAVDYIVKPCSMQVIEARLALRLLPKKDARIEIGELTVDAVSRIVLYKDKPIALTSSEFNILFFLVNNAGKFFSADEIYENVWGTASLQTKTIRKHVSALRQKLNEFEPNKNLILTEFGRGYSFIKESNV